MDNIEQQTLLKIYSILPAYWAVWRNRFDTWSIGEIGGEYDAEHGARTKATETGDLENIYNFALKKFNNT